MRTRRPDVPAMIFGLLFMGLATWYFADHAGGFGLAGLAWITAIMLILLGIVGITSALRNTRE